MNFQTFVKHAPLSLPRMAATSAYFSWACWVWGLSQPVTDFLKRWSKSSRNTQTGRETLFWVSPVQIRMGLLRTSGHTAMTQNAYVVSASPNTPVAAALLRASHHPKMTQNICRHKPTKKRPDSLDASTPRRMQKGSCAALTC